MKNIGDYIRLALTLILLFFVYQETGVATTIFAFLVAARSEVKDYNDGITFMEVHHD